ncbi:MAG: nitroreductase family protein [Gammaproteobacteria bacterium]|nr:nitroreductase family protein [Gammaproteobacteria bacterium]
MTDATFIPLPGFVTYPEAEMLERAEHFLSEAKRRRTVREFSDRPVPRALIETCLQTAGTAVSGANMQPWQFVAVQDRGIKRDIRVAAEAEERAFYNGKAPREWLDALAPLGTDANKPFLETAPWLIAVFQQRFGVLPDGRRVKHYYATESVGIATGLLISAIHHAGLASLTHTPSPMKFLNRILGRPRNERPFLLLVVGYPAPNATVPDIGRKDLTDIATFV